MSTKKDTVRVNRRTLERLKGIASMALGEEIKLAREAIHIARDGERRGEWLQQTGRSLKSFKGETPEEIQSIQNRSTIRSAGVGALLAWLANADFVKNWQLAKDNWWLMPIAVLALGWWLKNRGYKDAPAILTFGGVLLVQAYQRHQQDEEDKKKAPPAAAPANIPANQPASPNAAGFDTGAIHPMGNYAWLQDPYGRWVKLAMPAALPAALPNYANRFGALPAANMNTGAPTQEDYEAAQQIAAATFAA